MPSKEHQLTIVISNGMPGQESWAKVPVPDDWTTMELSEFTRRYVTPALVVIAQHAKERLMSHA